MTEHRIDLTWADLPLSMNKSMHYHQAARERQMIIHEVTTRARAQHLPRDVPAIVVELHWQPRVIRARDTDNPAPSIKAIIDALVRYGMVADDDHTRVRSESVIHPADKASKVKFWVRVIELDHRIGR